MRQISQLKQPKEMIKPAILIIPLAKALGHRRNGVAPVEDDADTDDVGGSLVGVGHRGNDDYNLGF